MKWENIPDFTRGELFSVLMATAQKNQSINQSKSTTRTLLSDGAFALRRRRGLDLVVK